jgi:hypothetical protein
LLARIQQPYLQEIKNLTRESILKNTHLTAGIRKKIRDKYISCSTRTKSLILRNSKPSVFASFSEFASWPVDNQANHSYLLLLAVLNM